jgi:hypothetical protein
LTSDNRLNIYFFGVIGSPFGVILKLLRCHIGTRFFAGATGVLDLPSVDDGNGDFTSLLSSLLSLPSLLPSFLSLPLLLPSLLSSLLSSPNIRLPRLGLILVTPLAVADALDDTLL